MNETQTENSTKLHQQNSDENLKIDNINASKILSVEDKVTNEGINETNVICEQKYRLVSEDCVKVASEINNEAGTSTSWDTAFGEINQTSCVQKDRLPNEDCVKVSNETNNEAGTSTSCGIDFVSSGIIDSAKKTIEKTEESSTNLSENVDIYQMLKGNITTGSDKVKSLKTYESSVDSVETITNNNFELKETTSNKNIESSTDETDSKSNNTKELKLTVDSNITQTINEPDLPNSLENIGKKDEITNKSIKKKPLSAREILKKSIEIRGRRLERIAVSQSLEKVELKNDLESNNVEEGKVVDDKVLITNSGFEEDSCKAETFVKNVTKSIDKVANSGCFLEDEKGKKEKFNGDKGIKNSESLSESVVEVNGTVGDTGVDLVEKTFNKNIDENCGEGELLANLSIINSDKIVVEQNFNEKIEENVGEKCLGATLQARNFKETTDDNVEKATDENIEKSTDEIVEKPFEENIEKQVSLRRGRRRKSIISQNLQDNVNSSIVNNIEVDGKCIEEYSTLPKTRKLRKRSAPCQDIAGKSDENIEVQEENSSGRKSLNKSLEGRRNREVNSSQNVDSNEFQTLEEPVIDREVISSQNFDSNEYENSETSSINLKFEEEKFEGTAEEPLMTVVAQRKLLKTGMRKLKNKNDCQIIENVGKSVDKVYKTCENVGDLLKKFDKNSEKVSKGSTKVKGNRGRPKKSAKSIIGNDQNTFCEIREATNGSNGNKLTNIDDLLRDVLRNLTKSCGESVITLANNSAQNGDNLLKFAAENVNNLSESVNSLSNCETNTNTVVAIKKKVGRPKKVRKTLKARKLLERTPSNSKTSDVCEESNNSCDSNGNKKVCRPKKARKGRSEVEKLLESASNFTSNISEACEESTSSAVADVNQLSDNCNVAAVNRLELVSKKLRKGCRTKSSKYMECDGKDPLENIVVMMEDGPKTTLDPEVQLLNEMNKSKSLEENPDPEPPSCPRYSTNNLTEDGLRMIIKKEINNSAEKHTSSPEIYEESSFEYGNVTHKVRYIIRKEKAKLVETTVGSTNDTYNEENNGSNLTEEIMNLALTQAIKAEPIDNPENLLLETEDNETREYTVNSTEQKDTFDEKPFANQPQTVKFRTKNRGRGRNSFLIPKTVDINGYVNRCKQTTVNTVDDKKYNKKQCGNYTMEIKTEIAENNSFIDENSDSLGIKTGLNRIRRRRRVSKRGRGRLRASDRVANGYKLCENLVKNFENESDLVENCRNLRSTSRLFENCGISDLKNDVINSTMDVRSIRNSMEDVESVRNSTEDVESVRNSTEDVENCTNHTKSGENRIDDDKEIVRNCTIDIRSVRNSTEDNESSSDEKNVKNSTIDIRSVRNSTEDNDNVEISAKNSKEVAGNVKNSTVTSSNRILVKSLASLMGNSGSNQGTNLLNSPCTSKSSSNKSLVKNLANIVSKLDSIAKNNLNNDEESPIKVVSNDDSIAENNLKNCEESVGKAVLNNMVENRIDSNNGVIVNLGTLDLDSSMDDSEVTVSKISNSNSNNDVSSKLDSNSGENFNETGSISEKVLKMSSTSSENSTKTIPNDKLDKFNIDENVGRSLRKRKKIVNYDDNFVKIVDNYSGVGQNLDGFGEKIENLTSFIDNSPPSKNVILKSPAKIFSRKIKLSSKTNYTGRLKVFCDKSNDNVKFTSPVKVEANTVPLDFSSVSNSADTVSNNAHDVSNGSNLIGTVSNSDRLLGSAVSNGNSLLNTGSNTDVSNSDRLLNIVSNGDYLLDTVSNGDDRLLDTVSNRDESDYEEKYGDVLEAERLKDNEEEFLKTIESFLEEEIEKHAEENGKKARKKRRRLCELPPLPDMLKCATCGKVLKNRQSYEYHVTTHTDPRKQLMKCNCCSKVLVGEKRFKSHMYKFHTLVKTYSCDRCKKIFHTRHNLYKHMVNVHLKLKTYTCDICKKSFKRKSYLTLHINMHMGIRPHECNLCGKNFLSKSDLQNHLDAHVGFDRYVCGVCGKRASNMHSLQVHMKSIHTRENLFKCRRCGKEYGTRSCLREHMNLHTGKTYECEKCGEKFPYRNSLKRHLKTHEGKKQKCEICHKVFQRKCYLKKHMTIHSGTEQFMCVYCGKKFIEKSDFNQHVNRHTHAEKFPCEFCGKVFHSKGYLVNHRKMHTGDTKHVCKYCGKKFMKKGLLERHESIHEGTNFVQCDLCGAVLSSVNSCRRHVRNVHGVVL